MNSSYNGVCFLCLFVWGGGGLVLLLLLLLRVIQRRYTTEALRRLLCRAPGAIKGFWVGLEDIALHASPTVSNSASLALLIYLPESPPPPAPNALHTSSDVCQNDVCHKRDSEFYL